MTLPTGNRSARHAWPLWPRAFTLVELLLVMTILVVVIGLAMPSLAHFFRGRALEAEARRLLALTWVDAPRRAYGLEEEPGWRDLDPKAVEFTLAEDVRIETPATVLFPLEATTVKPGTLGAPRTSSLTGRTNPARERGPHAGLPAIRFLPDGSFAETSLQALRLIGREGAELWLAQTRYRFNYEIRSQIVQYYEARR
jgi:prepilin-type N-terminal cleavage/methylation domain-containing protein